MNSYLSAKHSLWSQFIGLPYPLTGVGIRPLTAEPFTGVARCLSNLFPFIPEIHRTSAREFHKRLKAKQRDSVLLNPVNRNSVAPEFNDLWGKVSRILTVYALKVEKYIVRNALDFGFLRRLVQPKELIAAGQVHPRRSGNNAPVAQGTNVDQVTKVTANESLGLRVMHPHVIPQFKIRVPYSEELNRAHLDYQFQLGWTLVRMVAQRLCKRSLVAPAQPLSRTDAGKVDRDYFRPLGGAHCLPIQRQHEIRPSIPSLGGSGVPSNVARFVPLVVVDALHCVFRGGARPDVIIKGLKVFDPRLEHCNTTTTVSIPRGVRGGQASGLNVRPNTVFGAVTHSVSKGFRFARTFATRRYKSISQVTRANICRPSTLTKARPVNLASPSAFISETLYDKFSKWGSKGYINSGWQALSSTRKICWQGSIRRWSLLFEPNLF